jgi:RNA polymerase sigma-70 factor (ECF subfamily)
MGQDGRDEQELISRACGGDAAAFSQLARRYIDRVRATAYHVAGNSADADDITQEALLRAYQRLRAFDGRSRFFTWLYRIVVNTALNHLRSSRRRRDRVDKSTRDLPEAWAKEIDDHPDPERRAAVRQRYERAMEALDGLSESLRITVTMVVIDEVPYADAAEILGIPRGTVAWRLNQARKLLKDKMDLGKLPSELAEEKNERGEPSEDPDDDELRRDKKSAVSVP